MSVYNDMANDAGLPFGSDENRQMAAMIEDEREKVEAMNSLERPILFSSAMVRAILDGRKTMTRRVVRPQPDGNLEPIRSVPGWYRQIDNGESENDRRCPYTVSMRLWVRETWNQYPEGTLFYRADGKPIGIGWKWRPSIFMPRWASRITLEVTAVRCERLQEITHKDALAEGVGCDVSDGEDGAPVPRFRALWDSLNSKRGFGWGSNPWVWAVSFRRVTP